MTKQNNLERNIGYVLTTVMAHNGEYNYSTLTRRVRYTHSKTNPLSPDEARQAIDVAQKRGLITLEGATR